MKYFIETLIITHLICFYCLQAETVDKSNLKQMIKMKKSVDTAAKKVGGPFKSLGSCPRPALKFFDQKGEKDCPPGQTRKILPIEVRNLAKQFDKEITSLCLPEKAEKTCKYNNQPYLKIPIKLMKLKPKWNLDNIRNAVKGVEELIKKIPIDCGIKPYPNLSFASEVGVKSLCCKRNPHVRYEPMPSLRLKRLGVDFYCRKKINLLGAAIEAKIYLLVLFSTNFSIDPECKDSLYCVDFILEIEAGGKVVGQIQLGWKWFKAQAGVKGKVYIDPEMSLRQCFKGQEPYNENRNDGAATFKGTLGQIKAAFSAYASIDCGWFGNHGVKYSTSFVIWDPDIKFVKYIPIF